MGNTLCGAPSAPTQATTHDAHDHDAECTYGSSGTEVECKHLLNVRRSVCHEETAHMNFVSLIWKYAHRLALDSKDIEGGEVPQWIESRCQQIETISSSSRTYAQMNCLLRQKFLAADDFLEFFSKILWGNHMYAVDFAWEVCNVDGGDDIISKDSLPAKDVIQFFVQTGILVHYMHLDHAFEVVDNGSLGLREPRNLNGEQNIIQSLANSLMEYSASARGLSTFEYGGHTNTNATSGTIEDDASITKREFIEWQRKVVPDLLHNGIVRFFHVLFFPPEKSGDPSFANERQSALFRRYNRLLPILHSSQEKVPRIASRLKKGEVVPSTSAVFGKNHVEIKEKKNGDSVGCAAKTAFSPPMFVFTTISASKLGNEWYRLFSGTEDGWTFNQLEHSIIGYQGPTLIIIQASSNQHPNGSVTFGAYTASKWEKNKKNFFGSTDCFLFQLEPTLRVMKSLPKMGTRGGHYMYFHSTTNVVSSNPAKKDEMIEGLGFGGTIRKPRLFIDRTLEECNVSSHDTSFEEGLLGFPPSNNLLISSSGYSPYPSSSLSTSLHIDSLEIYAVGDDDTIRRGFQALLQYREIADANLKNARTVDKAAFMGDLRSGVIESKAFAHLGQVDGRANGALRDEDGKLNGL
eukprot:CCRYP_015918-RB/>CCRYP_015918-RB protein AED:0.21 eAED:0.21 QI:250/1/1/1/1/1/2/733/633